MGVCLSLLRFSYLHVADISIGGVVITTEGGKIRLENTFESRLEICYQQNLPYFRETLGFNDE